jgi:hypothetical protein
MLILPNTAAIAHANHPICPTVAKQSAEEVTALLLGSLSEVRRGWKAKAGDDSCLVCYYISKPATDFMPCLLFKATPFGMT